MGAGNPTISRETETQVPAACQPQPRQPHIIKCISQLQKPARKITDTWIIDTGKRETRYRLVKVHQTIRRQTESNNFGYCYGKSQTLCDPMDYTVHGILQARILKWIAFPFSRGSQLRDPTKLSPIAGRSFPAEPQGNPLLIYSTTNQFIR